MNAESTEWNKSLSSLIEIKIVAIVTNNFFSRVMFMKNKKLKRAEIKKRIKWACCLKSHCQWACHITHEWLSNLHDFSGVSVVSENDELFFKWYF